jgi:predicted adenylyl cyclase CyaB
MVIEVEIRSFVSKEKYDELLKYFKENSKLLEEDYQESYYFDSKCDLRIQKNNKYSKIWLKKGKMHDESREELEVKCKKEDFEKLEKIFTELGFSVNIKWFRKRFAFELENKTRVMLDDTKGYGYIIEFEKMSNERNKEKNLNIIKNKMKELRIPITSKEDFDKKFDFYKKNWKELTK